MEGIYMAAISYAPAARVHKAWRIAQFSLCAAILLASVPALTQAGGPVVAVTGGEVRGKTTDRASLVFQAIPFAAPPLADRRWKPPAPVIPWRGVRDATRPAASCLQNDENWNHQDWLRGNEDCLTLNVRTSSLVGRRPVMVWIHGGSNRAGSAFGPVESRISDRGVVVVSLQYRLGVLGFLSHRALAAEQGGSSGNYGLMDQIAGLGWVRDNIARFGGDPDKVTIFGESAGSQDVSLLLAAPSAQRLFRSAIMQSGTPGFGMSFRPLEEAFKLGDQLDELTGSGGDIEKLRALSPIALFALQGKLSDPKAKGTDFTFLRTTIDGVVLPEDPDVLMARASPKPVIIGTDTVEFGPGPGQVPLDDFARFWFGDNGPVALLAYRKEEQSGADPRRGNLELRMQSDAQFHCPANRLADLLASKGWPVWRYEFDVGENGGLTRHAYEISFVFDDKPVGGGARMLDYWAALAITGNPNGPLANATPRPRWEMTMPKRPRSLKFGQDETVLEKGQPRSAYCGWTTLF